MAELELQGQGSRKRARPARHVPPWGDARWDTRVEQVRDGEQDLLDARGMCRDDRYNPQASDKNELVGVSTVKEEEARVLQRPADDTKSRTSTFPPECLKWVPRKRHNSRWPIEPKKEGPSGTRTVAEMQPLIAFEVPTQPQTADVTLQADEKQMQRRSTRRLSRRISLLPGEGSPRKLSMISLSPAKISAPATSPVKRPPVALSPTKVVDSPLRSFRVNATPTKVVLESPKASPPEQSPSKTPPTASTPDVVVTRVVQTTASDVPHAPASPAPLIFDQPIPDAQVEAQHETRRRVSLYSARRIDRGSSGASRLLALKTGRGSLNRRHSFSSIGEGPANVQKGPKGRRNTLDVFCAGPEELRGAAPTEENATAIPHLSKAQEVVEIDMKTHLDIFTQSHKTAEQAPGRHGANATVESDGSKPVAESDTPSCPVLSPAEHVPAAPPTIPPSPGAENACATADADVALAVATLHQAATGPDACATSAGDPDCSYNMERSVSPSVGEEPAGLGTESLHTEIMPTPHDSNGLPTIYEEPSINDIPASGEPVLHRPQPLTSDPCVANPAEEPQDSDDSSTGTPGTELGQDDSGRGDKEPIASISGTDDSPDPFANHVITDEDAMSPPDSPNEEPLVTLDEGCQEPPVEESIGNDGSLHASEDSTVAPPAKSHVRDAVSTGPASVAQRPGETEVNEATQSTTASERDGSIPPATFSSKSVNSPSGAECSGHGFPGTPIQVPDTERQESLMTPEIEADAAVDAPEHESLGFTPINTRQISPSQALPKQASNLVDASGAESEPAGLDSLDDDDLIEDQLEEDMGRDITTALDDDCTSMAEGGPRIENDTLQLRSMCDDSETEMLRRFVTRVTADRNAKAAAAAAAAAAAQPLAEKAARPARRPGSTASMASASGSPMPMTKSASSTPAERKPLGEKSANSPSPSKKRKLGVLLDFPAKDKAAADNDQDNEDGDGPRQTKRRRRRLDPVLADPTPSPSPEPDTLASSGPANNTAPRRSTRTSARISRSRVALRPTAPSANSIAFSMVPMRLQGMGMGTVDDEAALEAHLAATARARQQRSEEKDLAAVTRVNTRKNKAGAVPPQMVLARQAEDPAGWRMRELKGVFEAREANKEKREGGGAKKGKEVRWAEDLVSYHQCEVVVADRDDVAMGDGDAMEGVMEGDEIAEAEPIVKAEARPKAVKKAVVVAAPASGAAGSTTRRAAANAAVTTTRRSSRLQAPTPVKKLAGKPVGRDEKAGSADAPAPRTRALPKLAPAPVTGTAADSSAAATSMTTRATGMATRRSKIARLGMSVNGTPAPKRRGHSVA